VPKRQKKGEKLGIRSAVKSMTDRRTWWEKQIDDWFAKYGSQREIQSGYFRPSRIGQCARENMYVYLGVADMIGSDFPVSVKKMMFRGTKHHEYWYDLFEAAGLNVFEPVAMRIEKPNVFGHGDWIVTDEDDVDHLFEWKSTANRSLVWEHRVQWTLYSIGYGITHGFIVKEPPGNQELTVHEMIRDEQFAWDMLVWLQMIADHCDKRIMLDRDLDCGVGKHWGTSCDLYKYCHSIYGETPWDLAEGKLDPVDLMSKL